MTGKGEEASTEGDAEKPRSSGEISDKFSSVISVSSSTTSEASTVGSSVSVLEISESTSFSSISLFKDDSVLITAALLGFN